MQITEITATYQETANLGNYSNVKPSITLKATLEEGDNEAISQRILFLQARQMVQEQIDEVFEQNDQAAKYSADPRFDVLTYYPEKLIIIVPTDVRFGKNNNMSTHSRRFRLHKAQEEAAAYIRRETRESYRVFDCSYGGTDEVQAIIDVAEARLEQEEQERRARQKAEQEQREAEWKARQEQQRASIPTADDDDEDDDDEEDEDDDEA